MADIKYNKAIPDYEELFSDGEKQGRNSVSVLKQLLRSNKKSLILSLFLYVVKYLPVWVIPIITANIINIASEGGDAAINKMLLNLGVLVLVVVQNIPTHVLYSRVTDRMLRTVGAGMRNTLIKKLQHLSITYHKEIETGRVQSKFMRDIESIEFFNTQLVKTLIPCIINVLGAVAVSMCKSGLVTVFYIVVIPINALLVKGFQRKMKTNNRLFRKENENISAKVANMLEMIPVTKAHGLEEQEIHGIENQIKELRIKGLMVDRTNSYFGSYTFVISNILSGLCLLFTGILAIKGKINIGDIVIYQTYFNSISGNVQNLINIYPELSKGIESVQSVSEIMKSNDVEDNRGKIEPRLFHGTVYFDHVFYRYPGESEDTIKDFTLHVQKGECIAFVGSSGSGKSTIINMIIGFLKATKGCVSIDGKPIEEFNLNEYRHNISVVPQNSILFMGTIRDNITYGLDNVDEKKLDEVIKAANIVEFTSKLPNGLNTQVGEHGGKLSGGQKQRISIARALIRDPKILILDEATSALDNVSEYHVQQAMSRIIKGRTTFIVAHRLSTIRDADRIVVMENGRAVEIGTYDELMAKKGKFYELKSLSELK